jgi:tetratricopeptide (TPR) repeat protein
VAAGVVATLRGADEARASSDPREDARRVVGATFERGSNDEILRADFASLRHRVARLPLDASTRSAYATALIIFANSHDGLDAAAFHARTAARCAPVTVPVVRRSAIVLAQTGHLSEGTDLTYRMFEYDPPAAARLLATLEPFLTISAARDAVPDSPKAWLARIKQLSRESRIEDANLVLVEALDRWPTDLPLRGLAAERAMIAKDWGEVARLLPSDEIYPNTTESAILYIFRCRARAIANDPVGAQADLESAIVQGGHRPWVLIMAGDAWLALDRPDRAEEIWTRALHAATGESAELRADCLSRLARLAERKGQNGTALRLWRRVLELLPDDDEASQSIARLGTEP